MATTAARPHDDGDPVTESPLSPLSQEELDRISRGYQDPWTHRAGGVVAVLLDEVERVKEERDTLRDQVLSLRRAQDYALTLATVK